MNTIQSKCRPRHQVLVMRCYPRTAKGAVDVKPNSSELSYLLFYATSRRSKIQKIGAFLEKKTASDIWRMRIGNIQVTLGILAAFLEKLSKDIALITPCILKIIDLVLRSKDIAVIESSLPTFEAFCEHREVSSLFADHIYLQQYQYIVRAFAQLAAPHQEPEGGSVSRPVQMHWRKIGLEAIKCVASSDALSSVTGRQIDVILPVTLENLWTSDVSVLDMLRDRMQMTEKLDVEKMLNRRNSVATVQTVDTVADANQLALSGTATDVDKVDEEQIGVLAMQCLKSIFVVPNRAQIHSATLILLDFALKRADRDAGAALARDGGGSSAAWASTIYGVIARWAPVQDRYVILLAAIETMMKLPLGDDILRQHWTLASMTRSLLRSDTNLIGLSVMDVLLGFVRHIRKLLNLPNGRGAGAAPACAPASYLAPSRASSPMREDLLELLERCIGDMATHVYYADQISDMVSALINQIKPDRSLSSDSTASASGPKPGNSQPSTSAPAASGAHVPPETLLSHSAGRASALRVTKAVLVVANPKTNTGENSRLSRNRVPMTVWEGTSWLLRDADPLVRRLYVDALVTWLHRETTRTDANARGDAAAHPSSRKNSRDVGQTARLLSVTSKRDRQLREHDHFLPLLHLDVYDCALNLVDSDTDITLLHNLLTNLVNKLGVNATRHGVPMTFRLQEEVQEMEQPLHKIRIAALCHGYLWAVAERFDFETCAVGRAILNEIERRKSKAFWIQGVHIPLPPIERIGATGRAGQRSRWGAVEAEALQTEELLPFDDRIALVDCIASGYQERSLSPPASPSASSSQRLSSVNNDYNNKNNIPSGSHAHAPGSTGGGGGLPLSYREDMLVDWSRQAVVEALSASKTESLNGSRAGITNANPKRLAAQSASLNGNGHAPGLPYDGAGNLRTPTTQIFMDRLVSLSRVRRNSEGSDMSPSASDSSRGGGIASIHQLKMVLSGNAMPRTASLAGFEDDSDQSMMSCECSPSEVSVSPSAAPVDAAATTTTTGTGHQAYGGRLARSRSGSSFRGPLTSNPPTEHDAVSDRSKRADREVPPVSPLPSLNTLSGRGSSIAAQDHAAPTGFAAGRRSLRSFAAGSGSMGRSSRSHDDDRVTDLHDLLSGIDSRPAEGGLGNLTKPPYW